MPTLADLGVIVFICIVVFGVTTVPRLGDRFGKALYRRRHARKQ